MLAAPIARETGWGLPWVVGGLSAGLLVAGLISPRVGRTIGEFGGRPILAGSCVLLAAGLVVLAASPNIAVFVAGWMVLGAGMGCGLYDAAFATLGRLYGDRARPAITTLTLWGGFASTISWPLSAYLEARLGWRAACLTYGAIEVGISLPLLLWLLPSAPGIRAGYEPKRSGGPARSRAVRLGREDRTNFLLLAAIVTLGGTITSVVSVHLLTILQAGGLSVAAAVALGALVGPAQVGARVIEMAGGGRHHPLWTLTAALGLMVSGLVLLWSGYPAGALALALYGAGNGVYSIARGTVPLSLFGAERYAASMGRLAMPGLLAQALAPTIAAQLLATMRPDVTVGLLCVIGIAALLLVAALWRVKAV